MGAQELGGYIKTETLGFFQGLTFFGPDFASLCQLFFDNLSTLLAVSFALIGLVGDQNQLINDIVWRQITPACGLTLALGNMYFSWQATRLARKYGRPFTAQPYGLNTTAALPCTSQVAAQFESY